MSLPNDPKEREEYPLITGVWDYFPLALQAIAHVSYKGNEQHNPGQPLHWDRTKSTDHANKFGRHFMQRGTLDSDGTRHLAKAAWRILAMLQEECERQRSIIQHADKREVLRRHANDVLDGCNFGGTD